MEHLSLYERLKDEYRLKLIENKEKWPYLATEAENALILNNYVLDLTVGQLGYISDMCELRDWNAIYEIFN